MIILSLEVLISALVAGVVFPILLSSHLARQIQSRVVPPHCFLQRTAQLVQFPNPPKSTIPFVFLNLSLGLVVLFACDVKVIRVVLLFSTFAKGHNRSEQITDH
ncbi:unnamed protein product [Periconia digitata]|uniref:Uncharacterized protein n=1 Tax=Periconia digitata TaxID=1303443 RepID=A0A9W4UT21_9PLEO|nr:unnamed protein product [Periconia digitata]